MLAMGSFSPWDFDDCIEELGPWKLDGSIGVDLELARPLDIGRAIVDIKLRRKSWDFG